jgi:transposase
MEPRNIQKRECQVIRKIFDDAESLNKVLIAGVDYAEASHKAVICNGNGDLLCKPFNVDNDCGGLLFLTKRITNLCKKYTIKIDHVIIGGETPGSWAMNFASNLAADGFAVIDLHPFDVKKQRENETTDTDMLSALTICKCLINKMGRKRLQEDVYVELKLSDRHRDKLVKTRNLTSNRIHTCADTYFPGLLHEKQSGITPFSQGCFYILEKLSIDKVKKIKVEKLSSALAKCGMHKPLEAAGKVKVLAAKALKSSPASEDLTRDKLKDLIAQYCLLSEQIKNWNKKNACLLRQTPGALFTSLDGIGITSAVQMTAELGSPAEIGAAANKVSYFGLTHKSSQTGGDQKPKKKKGKTQKINRRGKGVILRITSKVAQYDKGEYSEFYQVKKGSGKNADYALGRKLIRFFCSVMKAPHAYLPEHLREETIWDGIWEHVYLNLEEKMSKKWNKYKDCKPADPQTDVLRQWQKMINSLHQLNLNF